MQHFTRQINVNLTEQTRLKGVPKNIYNLSSSFSNISDVTHRKTEIFEKEKDQNFSGHPLLLFTTDALTEVSVLYLLFTFYWSSLSKTATRRPN